VLGLLRLLHVGTNLRGFDNRHNAFTISNVALDATWDYQHIVSRVTLQIGHTPRTYCLAEPGHVGATYHETQCEMQRLPAHEATCSCPHSTSRGA
jgi:hypothetical protein